MHQPNYADYQSRVARNKRRGILKKVVRFLSCVVVFCTTYALILPAITMEGKTFCGLEEHTHSEDCYKQVRLQQMICTPDTLAVHTHSEECYDGDSLLICGQADYIAHSHDSSCYDDNDHLICMLQERDAHEHQESCYVPAETEAPVIHAHGEACFIREKGELQCSLEEYQGHAHGDDCFGPGEGLVCTVPENHVHGESCYESKLICTAPETHTHDESCADVCELEEGQIHTHEAECYGAGELICTVAENHVHEDACHERVQKCEIPESAR